MVSAPLTYKARYCILRTVFRVRTKLLSVFCVISFLLLSYFAFATTQAASAAAPVLSNMNTQTVTATSSRISVTVNPNGADGNVTFSYGTTPSLGTDVAWDYNPFCGYC